MSRNRDEILLKSDETLDNCRVYSLTEHVLRTGTGDVIELRRQSAEVLAVLIDAEDSVVPKSKLIDSVWGKKAVTDDSLGQCIADIRRALGDDARTILITHQRKGYQLRRPKVQQSGDRQRPKPNLAVLAFDDYSPEPDKDYLSDAIAEGIITELARSKGFATIARNSSFSFRGKDRDVREIAAALDADVILEGSQQKLGEKLTVTVQLIEAEGGTHIWAQSYKGELAELFEFQADIIRKVASTVGGQVAVFSPRSSGRQAVTAMHLNAKGLVELNKGGKKGNEGARPYFEAAIEADPNTAAGYIGLGFCFRNTAELELDAKKRTELLATATDLAEQALELDPNNNVAHYLMGRIYTRTTDLDKARFWFEKAKELNPSFSNLYVGASTVKIYRGQTQEAIDDIRHAMSIDPLHPSWFHGQLSWALWQSGDNEAAITSLNGKPWISAGDHKWLAIYQASLGDIHAAKASLKIYLDEFPEATISKEIEACGDVWTAPGQFQRWLDALRVAGMPE